MSFEIEVGIENGEPRLHILDADSRCVRLAWRYPRERESAAHGAESLAVQQLFRELFLLVLGDRLRGAEPPRLSGPAAADRCRH